MNVYKTDIAKPARI